MTRQFESTANAQMIPDDVKVSAHVSVGWGKRETQFQGKRAKAELGYSGEGWDNWDQNAAGYGDGLRGAL